MRPFGLTTLVAAALGLSGAMFAWHPVLADSVEPVPLEAGHGDPVCRSDNIVIAPKPPATSEGMCPEHATEPDETARARAYLIETATTEEQAPPFDAQSHGDAAGTVGRYDRRDVSRDDPLRIAVDGDRRIGNQYCQYYRD